MKQLLITIDGPAGAGKTTVGELLAQRLNYTYVDTGALYRGVAWAVKNEKVSLDDEAGIEAVCNSLKMGFVRQQGKSRLWVNGMDVSAKIRMPPISMMTSKISALPVVRNFLLSLQLSIGHKKCAVFEGRDMGTVVFPDADVKFFLDASVDVRAARRYEDLKDDTQQSFENVKRDMCLRDQNDANRAIAPLKAADDAIRIDSTDMTALAIVDQMIQYINKA